MDPDAKAINKRIKQDEVDLEIHFITLQAQFTVVTTVMVKNVYEGRLTIPLPTMEQISLLEANDHFITRFEKLVSKEKRSPETLRKWRSNRNKVEAFIKFQFLKKDE